MYLFYLNQYSMNRKLKQQTKTILKKEITNITNLNRGFDGKVFNHWEITLPEKSKKMKQLLSLMKFPYLRA